MKTWSASRLIATVAISAVLWAIIAAGCLMVGSSGQLGWTAGAGLEYAFMGNWTAKLEYLYLDLGSVSTVPTPAANSTVAVAFNSRVTDNIVRAGVNYKFDPNEFWANY